ncbi:MAG: hypothetical protein GXY71_01585 [Treponema sp.]|nr:hypothetical protein [Treponema sp.]
MSFDYYAFLAETKACPERMNEAGLASGFVDECVVWSCREGEKNKARQYYISQADNKRKYALPSDLHLEPDHVFLPDPTWFAIDVSFTLTSPWYSKEDRPFHVLDNPVRKDRVFGVPFMSAASWKGLLRWACRMQEGLSDYLKKHDMKMDGWKDPSWILHLFGNERGEKERFRSGALVCHPTWFSEVGFEVINPHSRSRRAGTQPIYYEVVPADAKGKLRLLYAPLSGEIERDKVRPADFIADFIDSIRALLETYGISAKRTAGWGTAKIDNEESKLRFMEGGPLDSLFCDAAAPYEAPPENMQNLIDENGDPISILLNENKEFLSQTQFKKLPEKEKKPCTNREFEEFKEWYKKHGDKHRRRLRASAEDASPPRIKECNFSNCIIGAERPGHTWQGGDR